MVTAGRPSYRRYRIEIRPAPDLVRVPPRFPVEVKKHRLIGLVLKELLHYRGDLPVALSRPCVYGVFSRPVGGLAPTEELCVGCLRCTVQYPEVVQIYVNPERERLGDSYLKPAYVDTLLYEARTGHVPVRGAAYRGPFGEAGWDSMWTDMSEIVRPTRDGIHGREFISTAVDIGEKPALLAFDERGSRSGRRRRSSRSRCRSCSTACRGVPGRACFWRSSHGRRESSKPWRWCRSNWSSGATWLGDTSSRSWQRRPGTGWEGWSGRPE